MQVPAIHGGLGGQFPAEAPRPPWMTACSGGHLTNHNSLSSGHVFSLRTPARWTSLGGERRPAAVGSS